MKKCMLGLLGLSAAASLSAATTVAVTGWSQNPATSQVTVNYTLAGDPAVVTLDVCTNGVSIGADNVARVIGDVNRIVQPSAETRTIKWRPDLDWEGRIFSKGEITVKAVAWPLDNPPPYMAVNLACTNGEGVATMVRYYAAAGALPGGVTNDLWRGEWLLMRRIPAAGREFVMGTPATEPFHVSKLDGATYDPWVQGSDGKRNPAQSIRALPENGHVVGFSKDFYMGVFPVTCAQFDYICCTWDSYGKSSTEGTAYRRWKAPVQEVSWNGLRGEGTWPGSEPGETSILGKMRARTGLAFDLPTESQWEFACRAGTSTSLNNGTEISENMYAQGNTAAAAPMRAVMWSWCYSAAEKKAASMTGSETQGFAVGQLAPNAWGLYDMLGNVAEWCLDWVDGEPLAGNVVDPAGLDSSSINAKAIRGGATANWSFQCRSGTRMGIYPSFSNGWLTGFRVVCPATAVK